jgi:hypothetical protein
MRRQTITRHSALALLLLVASFTPPAVLAQTQERKVAPPHEVPVLISGCPSPVTNLTLTATTPNVFNADFPQTLFNGQQFAWLNHPGINKPFLYTFQWKREERCCQISKAILTVKMKANEEGTPGGFNASNDGIAIMHLGSSVLPFSQVVYTPPPTSFPAGHPSVKQWTLTGAALANLNSYRRLSMYVQDDTRVESATLQLWGCCLSALQTGGAQEAITAQSQK